MDFGRWKVPELFLADTLHLERAGYTGLLAALLTARGIDEPDSAGSFLNRDETALSEPLLLQDMEKAVDRINRAISEHERLAVYGDYDVDGITASCLLCDYLRGRGMDCKIYIPDRIDEGYGLNSEALLALREQGISLVITVDCGITATESALYAKGIGLDIIITDHHECQQHLPDCCAVVNPRRHEPEHPAYSLAGVGVAMKLAAALEGDSVSILGRYSDLAAVGTIADVMPLTGENRILTHCGLQKLRENPRPGFAALLNEAIGPDKSITTTAVGYSLAPRINAAGRLCRTATAIDLLMCDDLDKAQGYALELCELNRRRQELEIRVWNESIAILEEKTPEGPIVLVSDSWHPGVVGIAASRLSEAYCLPAIIICLDGDRGKGSCRSYGKFNLFDGLQECSEYLESFGGHSFAAGINIRRDQIDNFRTALARYYAENLPEPAVELSPELQLADFKLLTMDGLESLELLEPCGLGNPRPLICVCDVNIKAISEIGGGKHLRISVVKSGQVQDGVFFGKTLETAGVVQNEFADICFTPQINSFRSRRNVQLLIAGARPSLRLALCRKILSVGDSLPQEAMREKISRDELALVWRTLRACSRRIELTELFTNDGFAAVRPISACLGIRVFAELGLMNFRLKGTMLELEIIENSVRTNLEESSIFRLLSQDGSAE